ncbi:MAG: hypothetical protein E6R00_06440 [Gammaproteobacteria bacterium]|nr:MAG: hypothetical protein E6R00_06440 [Gammaproteobacteria bacterium]
MAIVGATLLLLGFWLLPGNAVTVIVGLLVCVFAATSSRGTISVGDLSQQNTFEKLLRLARDEEVSACHLAILDSHLAISRNLDSIYREIALEHLDDLARRASAIADGTFVFEGTETWRIVYERLLRSPGLHLYRSVAWVKNANYWQDEPGRKSMAVNFELNDAEQLNIERIAIIADDLWPAGEVWPVESLRQWLHEQHARGIWLKFVRQSALANEADLIADIGIYGSRALGTQELDEQCRTSRFTLTFDFAQVSAAEERWKRLAVYAESWSGYLDRYEIPG